MTDGPTDGTPRPTRDGAAPDRVLEPGVRRALDAAGVAVATLDAEGHVVTATSAFAGHWGRSIGDLIGVHLVGLWPERHRAGVTATLVRLVEGAAELESIDTRSASAGGKLRVMRMTFGRLPDPRGRTGGLVCVLHDVTESVSAERRRRGPTVELLRVPEGTVSLRADAVADPAPVLAAALRRTSRRGGAVSLLHCEISGLGDAVAAAADGGTELLGAFAERLTSRLRPSDGVVWSSATSVLVVAEDLGDEQDAAGVAYRLLSASVEPLEHGDVRVDLAMTIGVVVADGAASPETMIRTAADALASAREDGGGGFRIVDIRAGLAA